MLRLTYRDPWCAVFADLDLDAFIVRDRWRCQTGNFSIFQAIFG